MTAFYVRKLRTKLKCRWCKSRPVTERKFCARHLEYARKKFATWAVERRAAGRCISCDCVSFRGWLRCRKHREINRVKCLTWDRANREHRREYGLARAAHLLGQGLCVRNCGRKLWRGGARVCWECKEHHRINYKTSVKKKRLELKAAGLCVNCRKAPLWRDGANMCWECKERGRVRYHGHKAEAQS